MRAIRLGAKGVLPFVAATLLAHSVAGQSPDGVTTDVLSAAFAHLRASHPDLVRGQIGVDTARVTIGGSTELDVIGPRAAAADRIGLPHVALDEVVQCPSPRPARYVGCALDGFPAVLTASRVAFVGDVAEVTVGVATEVHSALPERPPFVSFEGILVRLERDAGSGDWVVVSTRQLWIT